MKKASHILFLVLCLFSTPGFQELAKIPVLIQHYFEHRSLDGSISFVEYVVHHYNNVPHTDNDEDRDRQLPFKAQNLAAINLQSLEMPAGYAIQLKTAYHLLPSHSILLSNDSIPPSSFIGTIWQPPRSIIIS